MRELRCLLFEIPQKPAPYIIILYDPTSLSLGGLEWALVELCAEALHSLHVLFKHYKWCYLILVSASQAT